MPTVLARVTSAPAPPTTPVPRVPGLDRLRAVALVMMLFHHFVAWFGSVPPREVLPGWPGMALTDVAAPAFAIAAGASSLLFMESRRRLRRPVVGTVLRRYGLLIPMGFVLQALITGEAWNWGVLQTLGACVVLSTLASLFVRSAPGTALVALGAFVAGHNLELAVADAHPWAIDVLSSNFPLVTYAGFALVGVSAARAMLAWPGADRWALVAGVALVAGTMLTGEPDRYPADMSFVLPGLAGTFLLYGVLHRWAVADGLLRRAGTHTLGIYIGHYLGRVALGRFGLLDRLPPVQAVALAATVTLAAVVVAPFVPTLPWSPRTGWAPGFGPRRRAALT